MGYGGLYSFIYGLLVRYRGFFGFLHSHELDIWRQR